MSALLIAMPCYSFPSRELLVILLMRKGERREEVDNEVLEGDPSVLVCPV